MRRCRSPSSPRPPPRTSWDPTLPFKEDEAIKSLLILVMVLCWSSPLDAQRARAAVAVGFGGGGPLGIIARSATFDFSLGRSLGIAAGVTSLDHGNGICNARIPNRCDGSAWTWTGGVVYAVPASNRLYLRTSAAGGIHRFSGISDGVTTYVRGGNRPLLTLDVAGEVRFKRRIGVNLTVQQSVVFGRRRPPVRGRRARWRLNARNASAGTGADPVPAPRAAPGVSSPASWERAVGGT